MSAKKRTKYANGVVDRMDEAGEVQRLWTDFHQTLRSVREMKVCSLFFEISEARGVANDTCRKIVRSETFTLINLRFLGSVIRIHFYDVTLIYSYTYDACNLRFAD